MTEPPPTLIEVVGSAVDRARADRARTMTPLIVNLPSLAIGGQVWVRTEGGEPRADWRPHPHATWTPLGRDEADGGIGGSVEVAP